jgi:hypothetical protein
MSSEFLINQPVSITITPTANSSTITHTGRIYAYDLVSNYLVLQQPLSSTTLPYNYVLVRLNFIQAINYLSSPTVNSSIVQVGHVPVDRMRNAETKMINDEWERAKRRGVGVSETAQDIFDALCKTYPNVVVVK